jgi:hypothetical protein
LPLLIARQEASRLLGGLFTPESLRNLDSINKGPQVKIRFGKKIAYEKNSFIHWLKNYRIKQSNRFQAKR